jgi:sulfocyanin
MIGRDERARTNGREARAEARFSETGTTVEVAMGPRRPEEAGEAGSARSPGAPGGRGRCVAHTRLTRRALPLLRRLRRRQLASLRSVVRITPPVVALAAAALAASCGGSAPTASKLSPSQVISVQAGSRTVQLTLTASDTTGYAGFNFDGYSAGAMTVHVPVGWTVEVTCHNASSVLTHSCAVIDDVPIAPAGGPIAFAGASTPQPVNGIACGATDDFSFVATRTGRYRIACLVSGHEADGMWDWLVITAGGQPFVTA